MTVRVVLLYESCTSVKETMALTTKEITKELANNYILFKRGKKSADKNISLTAKTLRRTSSMLEANHGELFANMITNISRCPDEISQSFVKVLENIFSDNVINWGRIAILFTFAGQLAVYCDRHETQEQADLVVFWLAEFVNTRLLKWIENNGGWVSSLH